MIVTAGAKKVAVVSGPLNATNINNRFKASIAYLKEKQVDFAILQRRSPSCGYTVIYDGTFTGNLVTGSGVFAQMLQGLNIPIMEAESEKFV